jgi:hypothetical protein
VELGAQDVLDGALHLCRQFDVLVEEVGFRVVAGLDIVEDVGEEDDFELVEVEDLDHVQQQLVGVVPWVVLGGALEYFVGLVGEAGLEVLLLQFLVGGSAAGAEGGQPADRRVDLHSIMQLLLTQNACVNGCRDNWGITT